MTEMLQCPACSGSLTWQVDSREGDRIVEAEAHCLSCSTVYPVREGIGIFLTPDLPRNDLWEKGNSSLLRYLKEHPDVGPSLLDTAVEHLNPADQFYRAAVLDLMGRYVEARDLLKIATAGVYTPEQQNATRRQFDSLLKLLGTERGPIVDLASGMGALALEMLERLPNPVLMTDFSPHVLRENRRRLTAFGLYDRVSLLAFDARRTPLRDGAVAVMTTFAGLGNIEHPGDLLQELRRVIAGRFLVLSFFVNEDDQVHADMLRQLRMDQILFRRTALQSFAAAGWQVEVRDATRARVAPTPRSALIPDAMIDGLPVTETEFEFCVLEAR